MDNLTKQKRPLIHHLLDAKRRPDESTCKERVRHGGVEQDATPVKRTVQSTYTLMFTGTCNFLIFTHLYDAIQKR